QRFAQTKQLFAIPAIFKARQGRLRSQVFALNWIATHQQFVDRVGTQSGGIVGIRIPARNRHDPLRDQFSQLMPDLFRLPLVFQGLGQHGSDLLPKIRTRLSMISYLRKGEFMSRSNHTEAQMIGALKQLEAGRKAEDVAREVGVSKHTIYAW